jgi:hypothetical protein
MSSEAQSPEQALVPAFVCGSSRRDMHHSPSDIVDSAKQIQQQFLTMRFQLFGCVSVSVEIQSGKVERRW